MCLFAGFCITSVVLILIELFWKKKLYYKYYTYMHLKEDESLKISKKFKNIYNNYKIEEKAT